MLKNPFNRINSSGKETESGGSSLKKLIGSVKQISPWRKRTEESIKQSAEGGGEEHGEKEDDIDTVSVQESEDSAPNEKNTEDETEQDLNTEEGHEEPEEEVIPLPEDSETESEVFESSAEKEAYEKLVSLCKQAVERLRERGIDHLDQFGRIDMTAFSEVRNAEKVSEDIKRTKELGREFNDALLDMQPDLVKRQSEYLEMMTFIIFAKCALDKDLAVVRSAVFDDYINSTDTIMINVKTGAIIANNDEVLPNSKLLQAREQISDAQLRDDFETGSKRKYYKVSKINKEGGVTLEYAFKRNADGTFRLSDTPIKNVPIVHLSPYDGNILSLIEGMGSTIDTIEDTDRQLYHHFLNKTQVGISEALLDTYDNERKEVDQCHGDVACEKLVKRKFATFRKKLERSESFLYSVRVQGQAPITA